MAVIEGPGGPIAPSDAPSSSNRPWGGVVDEEALSGLVAHSPQAARIVLEELTARLREKDLRMAQHWSDGVGDQLLD